MARPSSIRDETILNAAREMFLARGIQATTAEVAERAGVSEGTLFNRFKSKDDLFRLAMMSDGAASVPWVATVDARIGKGRVREHLLDLALQIIEFFRKLMPLMMMAMANPGPDGLPHVVNHPDPPPAVAIRKLTAYFEAECRAGRIRKTNPQILARAFLGGLQSFVFFEMLLKGRTPTPLTAEEFAKGHVSLLWSGIAPDARGPRARGKVADD